MEQITRIELVQSDWKSDGLPLTYICKLELRIGVDPTLSVWGTDVLPLNYPSIYGCFQPYLKRGFTMRMTHYMEDVGGCGRI